MHGTPLLLSDIAQYRQGSPTSPCHSSAPDRHHPCLESRKGSSTIPHFWKRNIEMKYFFYMKTQTVIKNLPHTHISISYPQWRQRASCSLSVGSPKYLSELAVLSIVLRIPLSLPYFYLCMSNSTEKLCLLLRSLASQIIPVPQLSMWEEGSWTWWAQGPWQLYLAMIEWLPQSFFCSKEYFSGLHWILLSHTGIDNYMRFGEQWYLLK